MDSLQIFGKINLSFLSSIIFSTPFIFSTSTISKPFKKLSVLSKLNPVNAELKNKKEYFIFLTLR